jgi:hypothetical protein
MVNRIPKTEPEWAGKREPATPRTAGKMPASAAPRATTIATARGGPEADTRSAVTTAEAAALAITRRPPVRDERPRPSHARVSISAAQ